MHIYLKMNQSTLVLARGEIASVGLKGRSCRVFCVAGRLWVTASGQREDFVLAPGQRAAFKGRGRIVVEALGTSTVRVEAFSEPSDPVHAQN